MVAQIEDLARSLGGQISAPALRWKYAWMEQFCGYDGARRAQHLFPMIKTQLARNWDKMLYHFERCVKAKKDYDPTFAS